MCRDLPTRVSPLLDFLWDSEHRTGTDRASGRMVVACLEPLRGRIPGARKSHLSPREWSRAAALRPGWDLCPLAGKRESQCRGANKRDPEGNYFSRPAMVKSPRVGGQRRPASPDALRWTEGPSAEVGEQQVAAQQTDIVRSDVALDKQKGCKIAQHPDVMLELQREKAAQMHLVLLKEQFSNTYSNLILTARSLDKLYNFADCSGLHLIFALNALRRNPNNSWNSSSALSLLKYSASKKYNISWELGNEPNNYRTMHGRAVNGSQLGKDYIQLKSLLQPIRIYSRASLYGPNIGRPRKNVIALLDGFMKVAGSTVDAVTWQHCYIDGRVVKVMDFLKTRLLDTLSDQIRKIQKVVNTYTPGKKIWLEGVVTTSAGGTNNLSDSYAAGFLWLNTLGMLANQGIDVVIRHSFFDHGYNHLVDQNFNPLPDYWLSLLYKRLIGPKVLAVHVAGLQRKPRPGRVIRDKLRIYAHCTNHHNHNYVRGSITLFIINLHRSRKKIKLAGTLRDKLVHQYLLQPYGQEGLKSKSVQLNGQPLVMVDDGTLPELKPRPLRAGRTLVIPPVTMGFYVVKNVNALACRYR
ncbi:inactive heparanase-2 isoform X3 [Camelus dromedarius]|uniref:inactive heparanase-2 isoform X3 n=1 Tax=Camelus dromedarius TaxID=9838 RepID=UPI003119CDC3